MTRSYVLHLHVASDICMEVLHGCPSTTLSTEWDKGLTMKIYAYPPLSLPPTKKKLLLGRYPLYHCSGLVRVMSFGPVTAHCARFPHAG